MSAGKLAVVAALALMGCHRGSARGVSAGEVSRQAGWALVADVRLIRQTDEHDCGAAALAMVLEHWGVPSAGVERLAPDATDAHQGVAASALRDRARREGLRAYLIDGKEADLVREVGLNRPVLVGIVQRYTSNSYAHYAVVIGINQRTRRVLTLDPGRGLREDALESFATDWEGAGHLAVVIGPAP